MKRKLRKSARVFLAVVLAASLSTWGGVFSAYGSEANGVAVAAAAQDAPTVASAVQDGTQEPSAAEDAAATQPADSAAVEVSAAEKAEAVTTADAANDDEAAEADKVELTADLAGGKDLAAMALANAAASTLAADDGKYTHQAVTDKTGGDKVIRVFPIGQPVTSDNVANGDVAYCYDRGNAFPVTFSGYESDSGTKYWMVENVSGSQFVAAAGSKRRTAVDGVALSDADFRSRVIAVVANGYPRNASGILDKYPNLSDGKKWEATQFALWYYTNSGTASGLSGDAVNLYNDLIAASKTYTAPENYLQGLNLYLTDEVYATTGYAYQNLLSITEEFVYTPRVTAEVRIDGQKILENGTLTDKQFSFSIWKKGTENGEPLQTVRNNAKGEFVFKNLGDVKAGDAFTIKEVVDPNDTSITYDTAVYTATAYTNNDGDIAFTLTEDGRATDKLVFENYQGPEEFEVEFSKTNVGGEEIADAKIQILNQANEVVREWTSEEGQSYKFSLKPGTYTFHEEAAPTGYVVVNDIPFTVDDQGNVTVLGNSNNASAEDNRLTVIDDYELTSVRVAKQWTDGENQDGIRPTTLIVDLYCNGQKTGDQLTLVSPLWTGEFEKLRMYDDAGNLNNYTVDEAAVPAGYTKTGVTGGMATGFVISNTHETATTQVSGKKIWNDGSNVDGKRPNSVTVVLYADGVQVAKQEVSAPAGNANANEWSYTFDNLPKKNNGRDITYTVQELNVPNGYSSSVIDYDITNSYTPEDVNVQVKKAWDDANNQDGIRPASVTVHLFANGVDTGQTVVLSEGNGWTGSFDGLAKKQGGQVITYTIEEDKVAGYTTKIEAIDCIEADGDNGNDGDEGGLDLASLAIDEPHLHFAVTNTHTPETTNINGTKHWNDANDQDGKRPSEVVIDLYANGEKVNSVTASSATGWQYSFANLPKFADGKEISYTVNEAVVAEGYTKDINGFDITNTYKPSKTSLTVIKNWEDANNQDGLRPESIEVTLYKNGQATDTKVKLNASNGWQAVFKNLDAFENGKPINYSAKEQVDFKNSDQYTSSVSQARDGGTYVFVNTHEPARVTVSGEKTWIDESADQRPEQVTVLLKKAGQTIDSQTVKPDQDGKWLYSFDNLPKYENGNEIRYSVQEDKVADDYQSTVTTSVDADGNVTCNIVNKHEVGKIAIQVAKSWEDFYNQDGIRPDQVTVNLLADGQPTGQSAVLNEGNNWIANFDSLDKTKEVDGKQIDIVYTVEEVAVPGYQSTITPHQNGRHFTITNKHTPETTSIKVTKAWNDNDNALMDRPEYVMLELFATFGGKTVPAMYAAVDQESNWSYEFENLPKNINGQPVTYSVGEAGDTSKYTVEVTGNATNGFVVTNTEIVNKVVFSKQDIGGTEIEGADIQIVNANGMVVDDWTSVAGKSHETELSPGNYYFTETSAPKGYVAVTGILFNVDSKGVVTVIEANGNTVKVDNDGKLVVTDLYQDQVLTVKKTDLGGNEIGGADVSVLDAKGNVLDRWESVEGEEHEVLLQPGTYTFHEEAAPKGYLVVTDITFNVDHLGKVTVVTDADKAASVDGKGALVVTDKYDDQDVVISKTDINGTTEIAGAQLVVKDQDGKVVEEWTSKEGQSHNVTVQPGTYTLTETNAPQGYKVAESITFTVDHLGKVTVKGQDVDKVVMKDDYANGKVVISKTDVAGKEIEGAKLEVKDKDGNVVESWISVQGKNHEVELYPGTYTLVETSAPQGYEVAESITFTVDHLNKVTIDGQQVGKVAMVDDYSTHKVTVSKVDLGGKDVVGAHIVVKDSEGKTVDQWVTQAGSNHELSVKPGTYTFHEEAAPNGYLAVTDLTFTVDIQGKVAVSNAAGNTVVVDQQTGALVVTDQYDDQTVTFSKRNVAGEEIGGAKIEVRDGDGNIVYAWTSIEGESHSIALKPGTYTFHEAVAPNGYQVVNDFEFSVDETGAITLSGVNGKDAVVQDGKIVVTDQSVPAQGTPVQGGKVSNGLAKTGDAGTVALVVGLLAAALGSAAVLTALRRRQGE